MHSDANRYYAILGLDPGASEDAIRVAFRRRAKELHPDSASGSTGAFIRLKRAYDTLSDPSSRADYDRACADHPRPARPPPPPPPPRPSRRGSIGLFKYAFAMLFMGALSFGAIEVMISFVGAPPPPARIVPSPSLAPGRSDTARTAAAAPESARDSIRDGTRDSEARGTASGPWDAAPESGRDRPRRREPLSNGFAAWPGR